MWVVVPNTTSSHLANLAQYELKDGSQTLSPTRASIPASDSEPEDDDDIEPRTESDTLPPTYYQSLESDSGSPSGRASCSDDELFMRLGQEGALLFGKRLALACCISCQLTNFCRERVQTRSFAVDANSEDGLLGLA